MLKVYFFSLIFNLALSLLHYFIALPISIQKAIDDREPRRVPRHAPIDWAPCRNIIYNASFAPVGDGRAMLPLALLILNTGSKYLCPLSIITALWSQRILVLTPKETCAYYTSYILIQLQEQSISNDETWCHRLKYTYCTFAQKKCGTSHIIYYDHQVHVSAFLFTEQCQLYSTISKASRLQYIYFRHMPYVIDLIFWGIYFVQKKVGAIKNDIFRWCFSRAFIKT